MLERKWHVFCKDKADMDNMLAKRSVLKQNPGSVFPKNNILFGASGCKKCGKSLMGSTYFGNHLGHFGLHIWFFFDYGRDALNFSRFRVACCC